MKKSLAVVFALLLVVAAVEAAQLTHNPHPPAPGGGSTYAPGPHSITQSTDPATITSGNSVSCNDGVAHTDNSYMRRFLLDTDHGIVNQFDVTSVDVGIEQATGALGTQPIEIRLYSIPKASPLLFANLTQIGVSATTIPDTTLAVVNFPVTGSLVTPATLDLVVEVFTPNGQTAGDNLFIGSNAAGQLQPSYLAAADCGVAEPTDTASIGFPNMMIVMTVNGTELPVELQSLSIE